MKTITILINILISYATFGQEMNTGNTQIMNEKYYINVEAENYHNFKHFNLELQIANSDLKLIYLSSEEFGYSELWKKGDVYAIGELSKKEEKGIPIKVWEARGESKVLTEGYYLNITKNGIEMILETKRKDYKDSYLKTPHEYLFQLNDEIRNPDNQILEIFNKSYSEFMQILDELKIEKGLNYEHYNEIINIVDDIEFPIHSIQTKREFLTRIGICLGHSLYQTNGWKWLMIPEHRYDYVGWTIVNPQNNFGVPVEQLFFQQNFKKVNIEFDQLIELIINNNFVETEKGKLLLHEPWLNYDEYK